MRYDTKKMLKDRRITSGTVGYTLGVEFIFTRQDAHEKAAIRVKATEHYIQISGTCEVLADTASVFNRFDIPYDNQLLWVDYDTAELFCRLMAAEPHPDELILVNNDRMIISPIEYPRYAAPLTQLKMVRPVAQYLTGAAPCLMILDDQEIEMVCLAIKEILIGRGTWSSDQE